MSSEKRKQIRKLHKEMRFLALEAGIKEEIYDRPVAHLDKLEEEGLTILLNAFNRFHSTEWKAANDLYSRKSPEWWVNIVTVFNNKNRPEQIELRALLKTFKKAWKTEYGSSKSAPKQDGSATRTA